MDKKTVGVLVAIGGFLLMASDKIALIYIGHPAPAATAPVEHAK